jgi:TolA-binding protein
LVVLVLCAASVNTQAQTVRITEPGSITVQRSDAAANQLDVQSSRLFTLARNKFNQKNFLGASEILEPIIASYPANQSVYNMLRSCFEQLKYYDKEESLVRSMIAQYPQHYQYQLSLANLQVRQSLPDSAHASYRSAIDLVVDQRESDYRRIIQSMIAYNLVEPAAVELDRLREESGKENFLATELGSIYERQQKYREATAQYAIALADSNLSVSRVADSRLRELLTFETSAQLVEQELLSIAMHSYQSQIWLLLSGHYLKTDRIDLAFEFARKSDSAAGGSGSSLEYFVRVCSDRERWDLVYSFGTQIAAQFPNSPGHSQVQFLVGQAMQQLSKYDEALILYDSLFAHSPIQSDRAQALFALASINADNLGDCERALVYYDSILTHYRVGRFYQQSLLAKPHCLVRLGRFEPAQSMLRDLSGRAMAPDFSEQVIWQLAELSFFAKQFDSAKVGCNRLIVDYPDGFYVNDALRLLLAINRADGDNDLLYLYSNALLSLKRPAYDSAAFYFEQMIGYQNPALAALAFYRLIGLNIDRGDSSLALSQIEMFQTSFADSYYLPYVLRVKGDLLYDSDLTREEARAIYQQLLSDYPNYPFSGEVRKKLRAKDPA